MMGILVCLISYLGGIATALTAVLIQQKDLTNEE